MAHHQDPQIRVFISSISYVDQPKHSSVLKLHWDTWMPDTASFPPFEAYTGNDSYIFVSYAHKDGAVVFQDIRALWGDGYRIWYDEGIDPGDEWPEEVAKALANASLFLVFISPNATNSRNVRNEINFAIINKKPFIAVHLTETQLPPGLELRMGDVQAVLKYRMTPESYSRKMRNALPTRLRGPMLRHEAPPRDLVRPTVHAAAPRVRGLKPARVFKPEKFCWAGGFSPDGSIVFLANSAGYVSLWDPEKNENIGFLQHDSAVHTVVTHPSKGLLVTTSCSSGNRHERQYADKLHLWDIRQGKQIFQDSHGGGNCTRTLLCKWGTSGDRGRVRH